MQQTEQAAFYVERKALAISQKKKQRKYLNTLSTFRVLSFLVLIVPLFFWRSLGSYTFVFCGVGAIALVRLVMLHAKEKRHFEFLSKLALLYEQEIQTLNGNWTAKDGGKDWLDLNHPYAHDLDLLGDNSIFAWLDRSFSIMGKRNLVEEICLGIPAQDREPRHATIAQLSDQIQELHELLAKGHLGTINAEDEHILLQLEKDEQPQFTSGVYQILLYLAPVYALVVSFLAYRESISILLWLLLMILPLGLVGAKLKNITAKYGLLSKQAKNLAHLGQSIEGFTSLRVESEYWKKYASQLNEAGASFRVLSKVLERFEQRNNMLLGVVLNAIFLWDIRCARQLELWQQEHASSIQVWLKALGKVESLSSLSIMYFNNRKQCTWPEQVKDVTLSARGLTHPVLLAQKGVQQTFAMEGEEQVAIVTGANMAGKSTFLRSLGVNWVLAGMGSPVLAEQFNWSGIPLFSSMRTTDSLQSGSSYFHAELSRLQQLVNYLKEKGECLVILDEILKGTNSKDKAEGSAAFVERMLALNAHTVVATHDLSLCELAKKHPHKVRNWFFDVSIVENDLHFDYTIREGICQNMNAAFLMKKMGIVS